MNNSGLLRHAGSDYGGGDGVSGKGFGVGLGRRGWRPVERGPTRCQARPSTAHTAAGTCSIYIISGGWASRGCERNHFSDAGMRCRAASLAKIIINPFTFKCRVDDISKHRPKWIHE